jgi:hypothetical protein
MKKILTDVYMYDSKLSAEIHAFAAFLESKRTTPLPTNNYDLVLDVKKTEDDKIIIWAYYYVDHGTKTLFWQHHYDCGRSLLREVRGVQEASHVSAYFSVRGQILFGSMIKSIQSFDSSPSIGETSILVFAPTLTRMKGTLVTLSYWPPLA